MRFRTERGFTLVELLTAMGLTAILLTLAATTLRHFWLRNALEGGQQEVVSQLRRLQQRVVAETYPVAYAARFPHGGPGSVRERIGLVRFDGRSPTTTADDVCVQYGTFRLPSGVQVKPGASVTEGTAFADSYETTVCKNKITDSKGNPIAGNPGNDHFVFFFARGTATSGQVTVWHTNLNNERRVVCVAGLTGRVYAVKGGASCS